MTLNDLWFLADRAAQSAEKAYHQLTKHYNDPLEFTRTKTVSRVRFRTLAERISRSGAPYGSHTIVYRPTGKLLLVRHEEVDMWVLPGGQLDTGESFHDAARRELAEEAGIDVTYDGLATLTRVEVVYRDHRTWGVMPVFAARANTVETDVCDPDGEISQARWFSELPEDTRDREDLLAWRADVF
ncbi:NUDIX hydrolase [Halocatena pleomorpha]|uniref:NUDIX domain-containing protein n=1 Tax=Halocatena pleomorpha TaxID=1785090 RepID=A0A3P3RJH0_9EURY|nr:NUDIX domain-containing protein [Halocatena pleomorpha]RRJ33677.1 NUDIX domain-containing protein [Halocatena pleomorpha]